MTAVDDLLTEAGAVWRSSQREPRPVDASVFAADRAPTPSFARAGHPRSFIAGAAFAAVVLVALAYVAPYLVPRPGGDAGATPGAAAGYIPSDVANCPLTQSDPGFVPPRQAGVDWTDLDGHWYGSAALWTLIDAGGEVWTGLPRSGAGLTQKTFWWSQDFRVNQEQQPQIFVSGHRLDGPGAFGFGPGTNAGSSDLGSAMLVGVDVPTGGCWKMTAFYRGVSLNVVVWVGS